jgi:hypothetical protein
MTFDRRSMSYFPIAGLGTSPSEKKRFGRPREPAKHGRNIYFAGAGVAVVSAPGFALFLVFV